MPFQIGASHMSPQTCLDRVRRAVRYRPSAIQVILPDWFPVSDAEAIAFLSRVAEAADPIGLVLYNPPHAKRVLEPEGFGMLKAVVPALVGIKVAGGDADWYARMRNTCGGVSVFVPGHHLATGIKQGAAGSYSNAACLNPAAAQGWYRLMIRDLDAALAVEQRLRSFIDGTSFRTSNTRASPTRPWTNSWRDRRMGPGRTRLRWPYRWILPTEAERLRPIARELVPEFLP